MRRDPQSILESGRVVAEKLKSALDAESAQPGLVCQFDCAGRGKAVVGEDVQAGIEMIQRELGHHVPWMGAFSFGEISPIERKNHFHNFTATLAVFY